MDCTRCVNGAWCENEGRHVITSYMHVYGFRWMKLMWSNEPSTHAHVLYREHVFLLCLFLSKTGSWRTGYPEVRSQ